MHGGGAGGGNGGRPSDIPLNPNNANMMPAKPASFDPISQLTQMSQQLSSTGMPNNMNGQQQQQQQMMGGFNNNVMMNEMGNPMGMNPEMPPGMVNPGMDMGGNSMMSGNPNMPQFPGPRSMSPKIGAPPGGPMGGFPGGGMPPNMRMPRPPMGYNGTNIQVKPNAPNTIQYLPARPLNNTNPPRPPPVLDFLPRFNNPMGMDEMNKGMGNPQQNMPYFQNQNNPNAMGGMAGGMDPLEGGNNPMMNPMMGQNPMMMQRQMQGRNPGNNPMMRFPGNQNPCMMNNNFNQPPNNPNAMGNPNEQMMFNNQGPNNPNMFVQGPKVSPGPGHDMQQQMHMMGQGGPGGPPPHFKQQQQQQQQQSQPFNAGDPVYAQQFHNFQQQLYATNNPTRGPMGMAANQAFNMPNK